MSQNSFFAFNVFLFFEPVSVLNVMEWPAPTFKGPQVIGGKLPNPWSSGKLKHESQDYCLSKNTQGENKCLPIAIEY